MTAESLVGSTFQVFFWRPPSTLEGNQQAANQGRGSTKIDRRSMPDQSMAEHAGAAGANDAAIEIEEEVKDFAARFAHLVVSRAFREGGGGTSEPAPAPATPGSQHPTGGIVSSDIGSSSHGGLSWLRGGGAGAGGDGRDALSLYAAEAELSLRGAQRLGAQLEEDAGVLRSRIFPALLDNARKLHALYVAIDRVTEEVLPQVEATVKRMEKAVYDLEELRKEQVDTRSPQGSFGLGLALGAGLWSPQTRDEGVDVPEVFDTDNIFKVEEGGLAPL